MGIDGKVAELARRQHGVVSRAQCEALGVTRKMRRVRLANGSWREVLPGVYAIGGAPDTWQQRAHAALLWAGDRSALARLAAAHCHGWVDRPPKVEIVVPKGRNLAHPGVIVHRSSRAQPSEWKQHGSLRITSGARTLIDLAGTPGMQKVVDAAVYRDPHVRPWVLRILKKEGTSGQAGIRKLIELLEAYGYERTRADSETENIFRRQLKEAGIPAAHHAVITAEDGSFLLESDFAWPKEKVIAEVDGARHQRKISVARRARVVQECAAMGIRLIPVTNDDVRKRPGEVIEQIKRALRFALR